MQGSIPSVILPPIDTILPKGRAAPRLFTALPPLAEQLAWRPLAHLPTPVEPMHAIERYLGSDRVWMKRDDLSSPLYGGNKVRRYEFVLADAQRRGKQRLVTAGGIASTQAMATALFGRALGFSVRIVLFDQPITRFAKEALLVDADAGAELIWGGNYLTTVMRTGAAMLRGRAENELILPGAANPLANLGYIDAMLELASQVEQGLLPRPDLIVLPTGSSGTLAALALGAAHLGWPTEILGVRITVAIATNRLTIGQIIRATDKFLVDRAPSHWRPQRRNVRWSLDGSALGPGYGHPTAESIEAIEVVRTLTGQPGEVTYSGKALAALRRIVRANPGKNILLWNTLSTPRPVPGPDAASKVPASLRFILDAPEVA
jgi:D-cysteine desulfhydrase